MATSLSSSIEYCASSILRWFSAVLLTGWFWTRKLRKGSRLRSLSTKSFSVYSGPLSSGGKLDALAEATGARCAGGGTGRAVGVESQALARSNAAERPASVHAAAAGNLIG